MNFEEWLTLSDSARLEAQKDWRPYQQGYWSDLLAQAAARFREETAGLRHLVDVNYGTYHGGILIIGVVTDLPYPQRLDLPAYYLGFPLMQFHLKGRQNGPANV